MQKKINKKNNPLPHALEKFFWQRGVRDGMLRSILCGQSLVTLATLLTGALLWPFHPAGAWFFWFGFGALLSTWNFYALIKFVPRIISDGWNRKNLIALLIHTNMRLLFTGVLLYISLVCFKSPVSALLAGLSVLLVGITAGGLRKALEKPATASQRSK